MVREVGFADDKQAGNGALQVVVDPQAAHGVVGGRVDAHGHLVGIFAGDVLVHVEQVAVAVDDDFLAQALDGVLEVQVDAILERADAMAGVDHVLGRTGGNVARHQVAEAGILLFEIVPAFALRNVARGTVVAGLARHPDATVVAQRLTHQGELGLVLACRRDAGRDGSG